MALIQWTNPFPTSISTHRIEILEGTGVAKSNFVLQDEPYMLSVCKINQALSLVGDTPYTDL